MAERPEPYVRRDPGDVIRSGDWNELQVQTREEVHVHRHTGGADGLKISRSGIEAKAIDGGLIDPAASVVLDSLTVNRELKINGKAILGNISDLHGNIKKLENEKVNRAGDTITGKLNIEKELTVKAKIEAGNSDLYFTNPNHNHTGLGNTDGYAAIENAKSHGALMILGRASRPSGSLKRTVKLWDFLQVNGDLEVTGDLLGAAKNTAGAALRVRCGETSTSTWVQYTGGRGVYIDIDTSSCHFGSTPMYITSLVGNSSHWSTTGGSSVYSPTNKGFRVYVRWAAGSPLTPAQAKSLGWRINWVAIGN